MPESTTCYTYKRPASTTCSTYRSAYSTCGSSKRAHNACASSKGSTSAFKNRLLLKQAITTKPKPKNTVAKPKKAVKKKKKVRFLVLLWYETSYFNCRLLERTIVLNVT